VEREVVGEPAGEVDLDSLIVTNGLAVGRAVLLRGAPVCAGLEGDALPGVGGEVLLLRGAVGIEDEDADVLDGVEEFLVDVA